ncbi:MAG TPA: hypothetical protein VIL74_21490 [Pyrinomonadaceae bacterium]|jgi:uncharacterized membrane protein YqjE
MENEKKIPPPKPSRELKGVLEPRLVRNISFAVITISLVASTVLCIWAIWQNEVYDTVWRAIATFMVVIVATGIFTFVNEKLG